MTNRPEQSAELSPLKRAFIALEQMQARLEAAERAKRAPIAIIGTMSTGSTPVATTPVRRQMIRCSLPV